MKKQSKGWLALISFGITDESFSIIATDPREDLPRAYVFGLITVPYIAWVSGTAAGVLIGESLPALFRIQYGNCALCNVCRFIDTRN